MALRFLPRVDSPVSFRLNSILLTRRMQPSSSASLVVTRDTLSIVRKGMEETGSRTFASITRTLLAHDYSVGKSGGR